MARFATFLEESFWSMKDFFNASIGRGEEYYLQALKRIDFKDDEEMKKTFEYIIDHYKTMPMPCEIKEALEKVRDQKMEEAIEALGKEKLTPMSEDNDKALVGGGEVWEEEG